jgi:hypothetical protein
MSLALRLKVLPKLLNPATTENRPVSFDSAKTLPTRGQAAGILIAGKVWEDSSGNRGVTEGSVPEETARQSTVPVELEEDSRLVGAFARRRKLTMRLLVALVELTSRHAPPDVTAALVHAE